jgi:hypothetical protein
LDAEIALMPIQSNGRAIDEFLIDVFLPQVARLQHVHVGIHRFETVLHGVLLGKSVSFA